MTPSGASKNYKWIVVGLLWAVCLFNYADRQAIFSVFTVLRDEMHLSDFQLGIVGSSFMWVYALAGPLAGAVGDRISRRTLVIGGLVFWSLVTIATAVSTKYWHLVLFRALEGFGEAFYFPASMSLISAFHSPATRSRAMALHQSSVYAGTIVGGTFAGIMAQHWGWRSGFYTFGSLGLLLGVILLAVLREPETPPETEPPRFAGAIKEMASSSVIRTLVTVFVGANFVAMIFLTWLPTFLRDKFNMSLSLAGFSATAYLQIASVLGVMTGGVLADMRARKDPAGRMVTQAVGLFCGVPFIFLTGWTMSVPILVLAMAGFGYFKGLYDANLWASLHDAVSVRHRATAVGVMNAVGWLGGGLAPLAIAAASKRFGMSASISANSVVYLLIGLLMLAGIRARRRAVS
ncbi:MAG TPA: MFS transporter [Bryobacteraceae bacterium]|nr:MFS transporter [Bryobacteraceae bacterium]